MLGTVISYTETYKKWWNKVQKFISPLTEQLHAWLADTTSETGQFKEFIYEINNSSFSLPPFPQFTSNIYANINLHTELLQGYVPLTGEVITPDIKTKTVEQSFLRRWSPGQEVPLSYGT